MSGLTPLIDTLLATRLAQRLDLVPLKGQVGIAGPGAVPYAEKVDNDIRLPSRAALQQQLGLGLADQAAKSNAPPSSLARPGEAVTLSAAARAVSAILDLPSGVRPKILGAEPLWPHLQPPLAHLLTTTLAHAVTSSGLFYESHLKQYAAGTRTLAQLAQEPQASLAVSYGRAGVAANQNAPLHDIAGPAPGAKTPEASSLDAVRSYNPAAAAIHPDAIALVRQQLEMLALPVFRWGGEAWPGTPMDWEIHEELDQRQAGADSEAAQRTWTTRLTMSLPTLGAVEVRLTLAGSTLQVHLAARENATLALLSDGGDELPQRFGAVGLQLTGLQIGALVAAPAAQTSGKDDAAALSAVKEK